MSIINDALKKTQQQRQQVKQQKPKIQASTVVTVKPEPKPNQIKRQAVMKDVKATVTAPASTTIVMHHYTSPWRVVLYVAGLGFMCVIPFLSYQQYQQTVPPKPQVVVPVVAKVQDKMKFAFDGVFVTDDNRFAIINKKSMHVGDELNGRKIIAINADSLTLQDSNGVVELQAGGTYLL